MFCSDVYLMRIMKWRNLFLYVFLSTIFFRNCRISHQVFEDNAYLDIVLGVKLQKYKNIYL